MSGLLAAVLEANLQLVSNPRRNATVAPCRNLLTVAIRRNSTSLQDSLPENTMGIASGTPLERGRVAYVFYGQTEQFTPLVRGRFLGHFMAHELGHLLLPQYSHSARGLMRARCRCHQPSAVTFGSF